MAQFWETPEYDAFQVSHSSEGCREVEGKDVQCGTYSALLSDLSPLERCGSRIWKSSVVLSWKDEKSSLYWVRCFPVDVYGRIWKQGERVHEDRKGLAGRTTENLIVGHLRRTRCFAEKYWSNAPRTIPRVLSGRGLHAREKTCGCGLLCEGNRHILLCT